MCLTVGALWTFSASLASADIPPPSLEDPSAAPSDPLEEVNRLIEEGKVHFKKAQSKKRRRGKRAARRRAQLYIKSLKSLSGALQQLTSYISNTVGIEMLGEEPLYRVITDMMDEAMTDSGVKKKMSDYKSDLLKALKAQEYNKAFEVAQMITSIDARDEYVKYLQGVMNRAMVQ